MRYCIVKRTNGKFVGVVAGCGKNRGTWDSDHSRSRAFSHAAELRKLDPGSTYTVEPAV